MAAVKKSDIRRQDPVGANSQAADKVGSPGWTRTSDILINSQALYQLSYRGVTG